MDETLKCLDDLQTSLSETRRFLRELAKHLESNEMPGQAGNCIIKAQELTYTLYRLDTLRKLNGH